MPKEIENLIGNEYSHLTVEKFSHSSSNGDTYWWCRCVCGNLKSVRRDKLLNGTIKSCGCLRKQLGKEWANGNRRDAGLAAANAIYVTYRSSARKRGYCFELTFAQFYELSQQDCYYCGDPPANVNKQTRYNGQYIYNGIDRYDNKHGYTLTNSVPCCGMCNQMKMDYTFDKFIKKINQIHERFSK